MVRKERFALLVSCRILPALIHLLVHSEYMGNMGEEEGFAGRKSVRKKGCRS